LLFDPRFGLGIATFEWSVYWHLGDNATTYHFPFAALLSTHEGARIQRQLKVEHDQIKHAHT
jgi:hypothetical protein